MAHIINPNNSFIDPTVKIIGVGTVTVGKNCQIRAYTVIELSNTGKLTIGDNSVIGFGCFLQVTDEVVIGNRTLIGPHCVILASTHIINDKPIYISGMKPGKTVIKDDVWLGANITVACDVTIDSNSIVGANSFVNKNIPCNQIWAGSPAKYIKQR
jgi:acetyltransferase-like isoleucine patch superfamily enzyme